MGFTLGDGIKQSSAATLICHLQRVLARLASSSDAVQELCVKTELELSNLDPVLCSLAAEDRHIREPSSARGTSGRDPNWSPHQKSLLAELLSAVCDNVQLFAKVLVRASDCNGNQLADAVMHDVLGARRYTPQVVPLIGHAQTFELETGRKPVASHALVMAALRRFGRGQLAWLQPIICDLYRCSLDLFDESNDVAVDYTVNTCTRILLETIEVSLPTPIAHLAATVAAVAKQGDDVATFQKVVFVDWIVSTLKWAPGTIGLGMEPADGQDAINLIVVAATLSSIVTGTGHQSPGVVAARAQYAAKVTAWAHRQLDLVRGFQWDHVRASDQDSATFTVRVGDLARIHRACGAVPDLAQAVLSSAQCFAYDDMIDSEAYVVLRADASGPAMTRGGPVKVISAVHSTMAAMLLKIGSLLELTSATVQQQLMSFVDGDAAAVEVWKAVVAYSLAQLRRQVGHELTDEELRALLVVLISQHDKALITNAPHTRLVQLHRDLAMKQEEIRVRSAMSGEALISARIAQISHCIRSRSQRFALDLARMRSDGDCSLDDISRVTTVFVCQHCLEVIRTKISLLDRFVANIISMVASVPALSEKIGDRNLEPTDPPVVNGVRSYISAVASSALTVRCERQWLQFGNVLEMAANRWPTLAAFHEAFRGRPSALCDVDEQILDSAIRALNRTGGSADLRHNYELIRQAREIVAGVVDVVGWASANDILALLAFTIVKARSQHLAGVLTLLGVWDRQMSRRKPFLDACIAVSALYGMADIRAVKPAELIAFASEA